MKYILTLFVCCLLFISCSTDTEQPEYVLENLPIESIDFPVNFTVNTQYELNVVYKKTSQCHSFYGFLYEKTDNFRTVAIQALKSLNSSCSPNNEILNEQTILTIKPENTGNLIFKLWKGKNASGENIFEEITVPVIE